MCTLCRYFVAPLLIHADDGNDSVQLAVLAALLALAQVKPAVVQSEISKVQDNFRSRALLDQVLAKCSESQGS